MSQRPDERIENTKNAKIDVWGILAKNYKDAFAFLFIIICLCIFAFSDHAKNCERLSTVLISIISASMGFVFGKRIS